jgi:hypothetical protein
MPDDQETRQEAAQAPDTSGTEPQEPPKSPAPPVDPTATARQHLAEQRFEALQAQLNALTAQQGNLIQQLNARQQQEFEQQLAELPPAERAERRAQMTQQRLDYALAQLARQQQGQSRESADAYQQRRMRELEAEYGIPVSEWDREAIQAGEEPTKAWLKAEKERRAQERRRGESTTEETVAAAVRRELAAAGVAGPAGGRASPTPPEVTLDDYKKVAWQGVTPSSNTQQGVGRAMGTHGMGQGKLKAQLQELRERAYREQGLAP